MRNLIRLAVMVAALAMAGPVVAGPWADAAAARARGDYITEFSIIRSLAEQGNATAQYNLGNMYSEDLAVPQDYKEAVKWYRLAAEQGNADAQFNLGLMYAHGQGVPQDYMQAVKWYRLAAEQGKASAQANLGFMYDNGQGVPLDYVLAHMWSNLGAAGGNEQARKNRDLVAAKMSPAQIAQAQQLAREWKPTPPK